MRLAPARPRDGAQLARIMGEWISETPWMPNLHSEAGNAAFLTRLIGEMDVMTIRNWRGPQGFMARNDQEIDALYLNLGARGRGFGARLLAHAKARSDKLQLWTFQANSGARRFYAREGFIEVKLTDGAGNDEKLPDVRLVWTRDEAAP